MAVWKADLDVLRAKARRAEVGAQIQGDKAIEALERKCDEAGRHLQRLKEAGEDAWEEMKESTEKVWGEIKALFKDTTSH